jgi:hypothetical protein
MFALFWRDVLMPVKVEESVPWAYISRSVIVIVMLPFKDFENNMTLLGFFTNQPDVNSSSSLQYSLDLPVAHQGHEEGNTTVKLISLPRTLLE